MNATDILKYEHALKDAGVTNAQAEIHARGLAEILDNNVATKQDLLLLKNEIIIKLSSVMAGMFLLCTTILGLLIKFH